ncbi:hypothetical protein LTR85_006734 [Meristemomyces frigidus]|nr:hypothetical protein LTR85_006734 [Meristemomyces frigidus]
MVELRKRPAPPAAPPPKAKKAATKKAKGKKSDAAKEEKPPASNPAEDPSAGIPEGAGGVSATADIATAEDAKEVAAKVEAEAVKGKKGAKGGKAEAPTSGSSIDLEGFGGEVETNDGDKVTLAKLVADSKAGVVLFTYPKASTPGCTTQACLFRDSYEPLTGTGFSIYGLSTDTPKSNTTFKEKQKLPYALLCDPKATLISAIGFKKAPKGTTRGVFVVDKSGKVLAAEAGGPQATVDVVKAVVKEMGGDPKSAGIEKAEERAAAEAEGTMPMSAEEAFRNIKRPPANMYAARESALLSAMFTRIFKTFGKERLGAHYAMATSDHKRRKIADVENDATDRLPLNPESEMAVDTPLQVPVAQTEPTKTPLPLRLQVGRYDRSTASATELKDSDISATEQETCVVESRSRMAPACYHGKGKAMLTQGNKWNTCAFSNYDECHCGRIEPRECERPEFRLRTASPEHDLRWWLGDMGGDKEKIEDYIHDKRFTEQQFRDAIMTAVSDIESLHQELDSLLDYAERDPYSLRFPRVGEDAKEELLDVQSQDLANMDREDLEAEMVAMERELLYMRKECGKVQKAITRKKFALAEKGDWSELEALWRLGYHAEVEKIARS